MEKQKNQLNKQLSDNWGQKLVTSDRKREQFYFGAHPKLPKVI